MACRLDFGNAANISHFSNLLRRLYISVIKVVESTTKYGHIEHTILATGEHSAGETLLYFEHIQGKT